MTFQLSFSKSQLAFLRLAFYILQAPINPSKPSLGIALSSDSFSISEAIMPFLWATFVLTYTFLLLPLSGYITNIYFDCVFSVKHKLIKGKDYAL